MALGALTRLAFYARMRIRLQRSGEALCTALLPGLALLSCAVLLAKVGWLTLNELGWAAAGCLGCAGLVALVAALWPVNLLATLVRLDEANRFSDRLGSAHVFSLLPAERRTPEMQLHIQRTLSLLHQVRITPAVPLRPPRDLPACLGLALVLGFVCQVAPPSYPPLPPLTLTPEVTERLVDPGRLRENERQLQQLQQLAARSGDETMQQIAGELDEMMGRLRAGTISQQELLERLDAIDALLAAYHPPEAVGLESAWEEVIRSIEEGIGPQEALPESTRALLERIEAGQEGALAEALEQLVQLLHTEELEQPHREEIAELLAQLADAIDPGDPRVRQQIAEHSQEIRQLQERLARRESRRDRRRLDQALERLARSQEQMAGQIGDMGREGATRQEISSALREGANALRQQPEEERPAQAEQEATPPPEEMPPDQFGQPARPMQEASPTPQEVAGSEGPQIQAEQGGQQAAASSLQQASARLRQMDQEQAASEALDQAERTAQALRENLQRSSQQATTEQQEQQADAYWESFLDRADGRQTERQAIPGGQQEPESGLQQAERVAMASEPPDDRRPDRAVEEEQTETSYGFERGDQAAGGEATELGGTRVQVAEEREPTQAQPTTGDVFYMAARDGFATRAYREVYVQYQRAAETALEAEEIPLGFQSFVRRYFELVEPR
ncbi:MAG: hypothetical protein JW797_17700 [Bradymonadales bacterium]|nr:hypothetical protein [Bradymonadales bacterium]